MPSQLVCWLVVLVLIVGIAPFDAGVRVQAQVPPSCAVPNVCPIGTVQGAVSDTADGRTFRSAFAPPAGNNAGQTVRIQGVIYEKTLARTSTGGNQFGFFIQNTAGTADGDPLTSDGIFVFIGGFATVLPLVSGQPVYTPRVGDEIVLQGRVSEFFSLTELTSPRWVDTIRTGVDLDTEVAPSAVAPPDSFADAGRYWERREGMRVLVPANSLIVGPRVVFRSTMDGEAWAIRHNTDLARRDDPYAARVFRDPHPLDDMPDTLFDNGNGFRIVFGSLGIKALENDNRALIAPARTFDTLMTPAVGGVYFSFVKYQIMIERQLRLRSGADPSGNASVPSYDPSTDARVATFNVENLYDFRDDPTDGCDFAGNTGCLGVRPPFDYVPESLAAYQEKVDEVARQIVTDLRAPDIVMVQEIEDQDVCNLQTSGLVCGGATAGDGKPDVLQDVALKISQLGGPTFDAATDRDGADDRGIINGYLFQKDRVELAPAEADHPVLGSSPQVEYRGTPLGYNSDVQNPKVLNAELPPDVDRSTGTDGNNVFTRPALVALFRIRREPGATTFTELYILNNHFSSTPNARVGQRKEQAAYNAAIVVALQEASPEVRVLVGGDLNVFPRPDDPFAPGHALFPSDQLRALYDAGLINLWNTLATQVPAAAYSYVFEGQAQTLDQLFITPSLASQLTRVRPAHVNSDWPAEYPGDGARGTSDHDPQVADFRFFAPGP